MCKHINATACLAFPGRRVGLLLSLPEEGSLEFVEVVVWGFADNLPIKLAHLGIVVSQLRCFGEALLALEIGLSAHKSKAILKQYSCCHMEHAMRIPSTYSFNDRYNKKIFSYDGH